MPDGYRVMTIEPVRTHLRAPTQSRIEARGVNTPLLLPPRPPPNTTDGCCTARVNIIIRRLKVYHIIVTPPSRSRGQIAINDMHLVISKACRPCPSRRRRPLLRYAPPTSPPSTNQSISHKIHPPNPTSLLFLPSLPSLPSTPLYSTLLYSTLLYSTLPDPPPNLTPPTALVLAFRKSLASSAEEPARTPAKSKAKHP